MARASAPLTINRQDLFSGLIFMAAGGFFASIAIAGLPMGSALRMGPGYFPTVLGALLAALGMILVIKSLGAASGVDPGISWRALFFISLSPVVFGLTVRSFGLIPATALCVGVAALGSRRMTPRFALLLIAFLTVFCAVVFSVLLGSAVPLFGSRL